jgi:hypothetical protein
VDVSFMPEDEDWSKFEKKGTPYDPLQKVERTILEYILLNGLPQGALDIIVPTQRRSKIIKAREEVVTARELSAPELSREITNRTKHDDASTSVTSSKRQNVVIVGDHDAINPLS